MTTPALSLDISQRLGAFELKAKFDAPSGLTALFGPSGSGKTSIINAIAGLSRPDQGRILLGARTLLDTSTRTDLPPNKRCVGYIFQDARLFPHMTVRRNLDYGRKRRGATIDLATRNKVIDMLGIGHLLDRHPVRLSGGEKQRVAIGRALMAQPELILADEPLASLDDSRKSEILPYFERLRDEMNIPVLYVTHSAAEVARLATTIVAVQGGLVIRQGPAADVLGDPNFFPGNIRDIGALLEAKVIKHHDDGLTELNAGGISLHLPRLDMALEEIVRVRIAAKDVIISKAPPKDVSALNALPGSITDIKMGEGPGAVVSLDTQAGRVLARLTKRSVSALGLTKGMHVYAIVKTVSVAPGDIGASKG